MMFNANSIHATENITALTTVFDILDQTPEEEVDPHVRRGMQKQLQQIWPQWTKNNLRREHYPSVAEDD